MSLVLTNPKIVINSVDLTSKIDSIHIESTANDLDSTTFGNTAKRHAVGLLDNKVSIEFLQDEALSSVEATIYPLIGSTCSMTVWPNGGTTSTTNPAYTFTVVVEQWLPLDGKVGELAKASITWPIDGTITKSNS
jgi:hypothetical protein